MSTTTVTCPECGLEVETGSFMAECEMCGLIIWLRPVRRSNGGDVDRAMAYLLRINATRKKGRHIMQMTTPRRFRMFAPQIIQKVDTQSDTT